MNTQDHKSSGRRRGPRRRRHNEGDHGSNGSSTYSPRHSASEPQSRKEHKPGLLQRILGFFGFGPKKKSYPPYQGGAKSTHPAERAATSGAQSSRSSAAAAPAKPTRKPEAVEVTSPKLYVGNLSFDAGESDLTELFNGVGSVRNVEIVTYRDTEKSKGFGFVTMGAIEEAVRAVGELHDKEFMGRRLVVSGAKTNERSA